MKSNDRRVTAELLIATIEAANRTRVQTLQRRRRVGGDDVPVSEAEKATLTEISSALKLAA